jgi:CRISPR/Cas system-associated exonuclease Cas4 (RecB family)
VILAIMASEREVKRRKTKEEESGAGLAGLALAVEAHCETPVQSVLVDGTEIPAL